MIRCHPAVHLLLLMAGLAAMVWAGAHRADRGHPTDGEDGTSSPLSAHSNDHYKPAAVSVLFTDGYNVAGRQQRSVQWPSNDTASSHPHKVRHGKNRRKGLAPPTGTSPPLEHDACYNTNEVLLIIGVTCAVNFAFIFIIMTFVHVCNRHMKAVGMSGIDSLVIADNGDCIAHNDRGSPRLTLLLTSDQAVTKVREPSSYNSVQEYVNSLPTAGSGSDADLMYGRTPSMLSLHSFEPRTNHALAPSLRHTEASKRKSSYAALQSAFSMEELVFVD